MKTHKIITIGEIKTEKDILLRMAEHQKYCEETVFVVFGTFNVMTINTKFFFKGKFSIAIVTEMAAPKNHQEVL